MTKTTTPAKLHSHKYTAMVNDLKIKKKKSLPVPKIWILLTLKVPPIICSRRQYQILPLFQK